MRFDVEIEKRLDEASCVIVVWSNDSVSSDWVRNEASDGYNRGILVPVQIDNTRIPLAFRRMQTADLTLWNGDAHARALLQVIASVQKLVNIPTHSPSPIPVIPKSGSSIGIAVLPFVNMSSDQEQQYFSEGLSEELLNLLSKVSQLQVVARTSSFSFRNSEATVQHIGEQLNVPYLLEGSVRKSGKQVRINAQLVQVADGYHLWSETYDRTLDDVFAIQDDIAAEVVAQLRINLFGSAPVAKEIDPRAYALFLQARHLSRHGTSESYTQSIALYKQALEIDASYIAAWDGLAAVYCDQTDRGQRPVVEGFRLAREATGKALELDPNLAAGHARLSLIANNHDGDIEAAARHLETALILDSTDMDLLSEATAFAVSLGRMDVAIKLQEYLLIRDPINARNHRRMAVCYLFSNRPDDAIASFNTALALSPGMLGANQFMGIAFLLKREPKTALETVLKEDLSWRRIGLALVYHALGKKAESDAALAEAIENSSKTAAYNIAYAYAFRAEADLAFEWLEKALQYKDPGLAQIIVNPMFANIHNDPRWLPFLESINRSPIQLAAIQFEINIPD